MDAVDIADFVRFRQMRMANALGQVHLADEPGEHPVFLAGPLGRQNLEGQQSLPSLRLAGVVDQVDGAHAPFAKRGEDVERAEDEPLPGALLELGDLEVGQGPAFDEELAEFVRIVSRGFWRLGNERVDPARR